MSNKFEAGEWVILQNGTTFPEYDGWLAEIIQSGRSGYATDVRTIETVWCFYYTVRLIQDGIERAPHMGEFCCRPWQLRKLGKFDENQLEYAREAELEGDLQ
jgi:hypothetical protein